MESGLGRKVTLWFSVEQLEVLGEIKKLRGEISISGLVRELLNAHLKELKKQ